MSLGICMARVVEADVPPGQSMLLSGAGRVSYAAYLDYARLNNPQSPGDPAMCQLALRHMTQSPGGDHDKIARALWTPAAQALSAAPAPAPTQPTQTGANVLMALAAAVCCVAGGAVVWFVKMRRG
jgi:hypothetical protein